MLTELPDERMQFTLGMYGEGDFYTMKGVVEEFFDCIGMKKKTVYDPNAGKVFLHPGRQANIVYEGTVMLSLLHCLPAEAVCQILSGFQTNSTFPVKIRSIPRYPLR